MKNELQVIMEKHIRVEERFLHYDEYDLNIQDMRFVEAAVLDWGNILEEDEEKGTIAAVRNSHGNDVIIVLRVLNGKVYILSYAREGLIKMKHAEKALEKLLDIIRKNKRVD